MWAHKEDAQLAATTDDLSDLILELRFQRSAAKTDKKIRNIDLAITECRNCIESLGILDVLLGRAIGKNLSQWRADRSNRSMHQLDDLADTILSSFEVCRDPGHYWKVTSTEVAKAIGLSGTQSEAQAVAMAIKKRIGVSMTRCGGRSLYPLKRRS